MYTSLHPCVIITLAVLPLALCQDPVPIQFQISPVLVATGSDAVFTLQTIANTFSITWLAPGGGTLGQWIGGQAVLNSLAQYQGRLSIGATQLRITTSRLSDAGNYTVTVTPAAPTGLATNSRSVALRVFDAVGQVSLFVPSVAIEGGNVSLSCTWAQGTETSVAWSKGGASLSSDPRISINAGSLVINPANRNDAGQYSCTVSNPVSAQTATQTLTVYYGPDPPQVNKTSSDCVGGGDVTVGQTVQLTCASVSLPPASLTWQFNGQPLTSSQSNGGTLSVQIFSANQSGQYVCTASNSVTMKTSQRQVSLSVVGTCLSVGAVAGIVVACFVALVLIIVAIVLILRQRKADRKLRTVIRRQNENLNAGPAVLLVPQNGHVNPGFTGDPPDLPMHKMNRPQNQNAATENNGTSMQNRSSVQRLNGADDANPISGRNNDLQNGPQNPNILIQTGRGEPGAHTVLINLNTLPQQQNTQPQTVQVSLNAPSGQPNSNEQSSRSSQLPQYPTGQTGTENARNAAFGVPVRNGLREPSEQNQPYLQFPDQTLTSRRTGTTNPYAGTRPDTRANPRQIPWDRMRGTPAYPNFQEDSDSSDGSVDSVRTRTSPNPRRRRSEDGQMRNIGRTSRRDLLRQFAQSAARLRPQTDQSVPRQAVRPREPNPERPPNQTGVNQNGNPTTPPQTAQTQPSERTTVNGQSQAVPPSDNPNLVPLTQAALRQHTIQTPSPFLTRVHQTQAALQHPGTRSRPVQTLPPARQTNRDGQAAPAPPPVLRPDEFRTLPREPLQKPRTLHPGPVVHHGHRPHNVHRSARTVRANPHRHPVNPHMQGHVPRHPAHTGQAHRSRPRP